MGKLGSLPFKPMLKLRQVEARRLCATYLTCLDEEVGGRSKMKLFLLLLLLELQMKYFTGISNT